MFCVKGARLGSDRSSRSDFIETMIINEIGLAGGAPCS
ncbi:hypothetical protein V512_010365 [Mesotoga sp. Brook.08.105.5.1]|nr:hypothetical protein V512_010365 [Mesotoga sp. Brook.08.105.5.1]RAO98253.1 hypothetical protein M388_00040 [Mesotoga sp. Brook.08.YT.4.2.5.4.]